MYRSRTEPGSAHSSANRAAVGRPIAAGLATAMLALTLAACSDLYLDRRDSIALGAGDAIAANEAAQTIDPWPPQSSNTNLAANGQRMQSAIEHYRTNTVVPPVDPVQLEAAYSSPPAAQNSSQTQSTPAQAPPSIAPGTTTTTTTVVSATPSQ